MKNIYRSFSLKQFLFLTLVGLFSMTACVKEQITTDTTTIVSEPQQLMTTTIYGRVLNDNNVGITGATVTYQSGEALAITDTDESGYFFFQNVRNKGESAFVSVQQTGKFEAFRRMSVLPNRFNYTEIKMNDKTIIGQLAASDGGTLTGQGDAQITLPANGIVDANGAAYTGNVDVAMAWIDPSSPDLPQRMVGDLSGIDAEGNNRSLGSFGMLQVELLDGSGNELNLAEGSEATLVFPVPTSMQGKAPATIPLWSYDEVRGTWMQEGEAIYTDGEYVGQVSHFSSWNVDCLSDPIEISGAVHWNVENDSTYGSSYLQVLVCGEKFGQKGGWLCDNGEFLFYNFPKNEVFELKIIDRCGQTIYHETLGPYTEDTDLGTITVDVALEAIAISGNAIDCADNAVTNGFASVTFDDIHYNFPIDENGFFKFSFDFCEGATGEFTVVDLENQLISQPLSFDASQSSWTFNNVSVCDDLEDFISVSIDGSELMFYTPGIGFYEYMDSLNMNIVESISYSVKDNEKYINFRLEYQPSEIDNDTVNSYGLSYTIMYWNNQQQENYSASPSDNIIINFTEYNPVSGGKIAGTYSGTVLLSDSSTTVFVPISGAFSVPID